MTGVLAKLRLIVKRFFYRRGITSDAPNHSRWSPVAALMARVGIGMLVHLEMQKLIDVPSLTKITEVPFACMCLLSVVSSEHTHNPCHMQLCTLVVG